VLLVRHSIGAWFIQQVLNERASLLVRPASWSMHPLPNAVRHRQHSEWKDALCHFHLTRLLMPSLFPGGPPVLYNPLHPLVLQPGCTSYGACCAHRRPPTRLS
jgi:hypothetical protein